jgi:hypothetical protein
VPRFVEMDQQKDFFTLRIKNPATAKVGDYTIKITLVDAKATFPARSYYVKIRVVAPKNLAEFVAIDTNNDGLLSAEEIKK